MIDLSETPAVASGRVHLKTYLGIEVYVTSGGRFEARYARDGQPDDYSRVSLDDLERDIAAHYAGYTGQVTVAQKPWSRLSKYDVESAEKSAQDAKARVDNPPHTITGVVRRERDKRTGSGGGFLFKLASGNNAALSSDWCKPNPALDAEYAELLTRYAEDLASWRKTFETHSAKYEAITEQEILQQLHDQGAKSA